MKKLLPLFLASLWAPCLVSQEAPAEVNSLAAAFSQGQLKGLLRYNAQYRDSNLHVLQDSSTADISDESKQQYSALGGYLGFETAPWFNTSAGMTFYTSNPVGNNPSDRKGLGGLYEEDGGQDSYTVLGEAFIGYQAGNHLFKYGRQEIADYRFVALSDIRMSPVTHQGTIYENRAIDGLRLNFAYLNKQKDRNAKKFVDMVRAARVSTGCGAVNADGSCVDTSSKKLIRGRFDVNDFNADGDYVGANKNMPMVGAVYASGAASVEAWDYYVEDFVNMVYLYGQYKFQPADSAVAYTVAAQYANQVDIGDAVAGDIDTWFYGVKVQVDAPGISAFASFNEVDYNELSYDGGSIFVRWGTPQMFNSFQVQDSELAGTQSFGGGIQYDFGRAGWLPGVVMRVRFANYDMPDKLSQADARQDRSEATFDLRYSFTQRSGFGIFTKMDGLSLQFRLAYNDFETDYDYDEFKEIHGYELDSVTDDFVDARFYLEYRL